MIEEEFEQMVVAYQQDIANAGPYTDYFSKWLLEVPELVDRFQKLEKNDHMYFMQLCTRLLDDKKHEVRLGTIFLIGAFHRKDSNLALLLAWTARKHADLRSEAISALFSVYTRIILTQLFVFADEGDANALYMLNRLLQTPEEVERGIGIARKHILAEEYYLREAALFLLQRHSSMDVEAESVLAAVKIYMDELFIDALKKAPLEIVLEPLKALRATIGEQYAEYKDLSSAIEVLEQKKRHEASS
jgi:hypothetical protein